MTTRNVTRLTLSETAAARQITIDGQELKVKPAPRLTLARTGNRWALAHPVPGLQKTHALRLLARFDRLYAKGLRAHPRIKNDNEVTTTSSPSATPAATAGSPVSRARRPSAGPATASALAASLSLPPATSPRSSTPTPSPPATTSSSTAA
ncbi:MAG: hypothetical protein ACK55F_08835 [Acidobacteriota bacterium]